MHSKLIRLIGVVFSNSTMLPVSDKFDSINECTHTYQQPNKITCSMGAQQIDQINWSGIFEQYNVASVR